MAEEPETYDLAFDPDDNPEPTPEAASPAQPTKKPAASAEPETFDLDDIEPEIQDPRAGGSPSRPPKPPIDTSAVEDDTPDEPVAVSPARAQAIREEQRIRAAQEEAEADARKKKLIVTVIAVFVGVAMLGYLALKLLG
ncbi:MAG: hypothetical protein AAGH99_00495 [Planctomycetota bacterium]